MPRKKIIIAIILITLIVGACYWFLGGRQRGQFEMVGVWQESPSMAAGWAARYQFFPSGVYNYQKNQEECDNRLIGYSGRWSLNGGILIIKPVYKIEILGGQIVDGPFCGSGKTIEGGQEVKTLYIDEKTITMISCPDNSSQYDCLSFGGSSFYKFNADPNKYAGSRDGLKEEPKFN